MNLQSKILLTVAGLACAALTGASAWYYFANRGTAIAVRVRTVGSSELVQTVSAPGVLDPETQVDISAEVSARIVDLGFKEGDEIHAGDVVVRLDDSDLKARLDSTIARRDAETARLESETARLEGPRTTLANAKANLERQRSLFQTGDVSRQSLDDTEARVRDMAATLAANEKNIQVLRSQLVASEADIVRSREELLRGTIISPIAGRLVKLNAEVGELVMVGTMNNAGTVILSIADLTRMNMIAEVAEADVARVKVGQAAVVRANAYKERVFKGVVTEVALARTRILGGQAGANAGTFEVKIALDLDGEQVLSGLAANVEITTATEYGLSVPAQAIVDRKVDDLPATVAESPLVDKGRRAVNLVFRMVDGKAVATAVKAGSSSLTETLVLDGLKEGEIVVTGPYKVLERLQDGEAITLEAAEGAGASGGDKSGARVEVSF